MQFVRITPFCNFTGSAFESRWKYLREAASKLVLFTGSTAQCNELPLGDEILFHVLEENTDAVPAHLATL